MASQTSIEWTATYNDDGTVTPGFNWNFLRGCSRVSEGCRNCYAEGVAARFSKPGQPYEGLAKFVDHKPRWTGEIGFIEDVLMKPLRWKKPRKIFVNSMSDLFHEKVADDILDRAFAVMALTPQHTYQILTKRPERMKEYLNRVKNYNGSLSQFWLGDSIQNSAPFISFQQLRDARIDRPLPNCWAGVSIEDQKTADERIPLLLQTPAAVRWISAEPLLGPVDITAILGLDWVVVGGESGPNARPMHPDWARSIRDQCQAAGVSFFFKQWGEWLPFEETAQPPFYRNCATGEEFDGHGMNFTIDGFDPGSFLGAKWMEIHENIVYNDGEWDCSYLRVGKKKAGRLLDGREWNEYPNG